MGRSSNARMGTFVTTQYAGEVVRAYVPPPLPPDPPVRLERVQLLLEEANQALGRLDGIARVLPDISLFLHFYVRKEAVLSSQIEGMQSSLSDLLLFEMNDVPTSVALGDVQQVSNYVAALEHGLRRLPDLPLSSRLIREIHGILLSQGRGSDQTPGEFRRSQNWIGGTRPGNAFFVPPPWERVEELMGQLEKFLHTDYPGLSPLVKAGLAHVQFESIHPFLDGNGRLGRLLITFLLCANRILREPLLFLSLYFKTNRETYYELLTQVRKTGDWESWLDYFLRGVKETSAQAISAAEQVLVLFADDRKKMEANNSSSTLGRVFSHAQAHPLVQISSAAQELELSYPTVADALRRLSELGIMKEITGRQRNRIFSYEAYLNILAEGT